MDPSITILKTKATIYEPGKPFAVKLILKNENAKTMRLRAHSEFFFATKAPTHDWASIEEGFWSTVMSRPNRIYKNYALPPSDLYPALELEGPILTEEQVVNLQKLGHATAIYFVGSISYDDWYLIPRKLQFCGSYRHDPQSVYLCAKT